MYFIISYTSGAKSSLYKNIPKEILKEIENNAIENNKNEFVKLPINILAYISKSFDFKTIYSLGRASKRISKILDYEPFWKEISFREYGKEQIKNDNDTWKRFVKTNFFEFDVNIPGTNPTKLQNNNKKSLGYDSNQAVISKNVFKNGVYEINFKYFGNGRCCNCVGIVNSIYSDFNDYICNNLNGRAVCNEGYVGISPAIKNNFPEFVAKEVDLVAIIDMVILELTIHEKGFPNGFCKYNLSNLPNVLDGVRFGVSFTSSLDWIEVKSVKKLY